MKRTIGRAALSALMILLHGSPCQAESRSVPVKSYTDDVGGISLRYPAVWTISKTAASYFPSAIAPHDEPLQAVFSFSSKGNFYEHTTLTGLQFLYRRQAAVTQSACEAILLADRENAQRFEHLNIHGTSFAHLSTGQAGMMKSVSQEGYVTWRGGTCYLFEEDLSEIGKGANDEKFHDLSAAEIRALRRHLNDILQSVVFSAPNAGKL